MIGAGADCEYFIIDCSTARIRDRYEDDWYHMKKVFEYAGRDWLVNWRENARTKLIEFRQAKIFDRKDIEVPDFMPNHVYGSFNRPLSFLWAKFPVKAFLVHPTLGTSWEHGIPFTYILSEERIPEEMLKSYELLWGWSRIE
jgi:hypothetical protein